MRDAGSLPLERRQALYSGQVQGVGFRYTAQRIAQRFAVTGYVQNLADGRVKIVAEGEPREAERFLAEVARSMAEHIRDVAVEVGPSSGEFTIFEVRH